MRDTVRTFARRAALAACLAAAACDPGDGPQPIAFDREPCAHCRMLISEPAFAAQLQIEDEDPVNFDDPGCLLRYRAERQPHWRAAWYHHVREPRWLPEAEVAFEVQPLTPMGYGLGAVDRGAPGSMPLDEAELYLRTAARRGGSDAQR